MSGKRGFFGFQDFRGLFGGGSHFLEKEFTRREHWPQVADFEKERKKRNTRKVRILPSHCGCGKKLAGLLSLRRLLNPQKSVGIPFCRYEKGSFGVQCFVGLAASAESVFWRGRILNEEDALEAAAKRGNSPKARALSSCRFRIHDWKLLAANCRLCKKSEENEIGEGKFSFALCYYNGRGQAFVCN